jgi:hypothetical protein
LAGNKFRDFCNDDDNVSPADRAKIKFEVELIDKLIKLTIVPTGDRV